MRSVRSRACLVAGRLQPKPNGLGGQIFRSYNDKRLLIWEYLEEGPTDCLSIRDESDKAFELLFEPSINGQVLESSVVRFSW